MEWQLSQCTCKESRGAFRSVLRRTADGGRVMSGERGAACTGRWRRRLAGADEGAKAEGACLGEVALRQSGELGTFPQAKPQCPVAVKSLGQAASGEATAPETRRGRAPRALQSGRHRPRPDRGEPLFSTALQTEMLTISTSLTVLKRHIPACLRNGY